MEFFHRNEHAREMINGKAGEIWFCRDCELYETCNRQFGKVHPLSLYVYRYLIDMENGVKIYPHCRSWEYEPEWFIQLLTSATAKLHEIQKEKALNEHSH